MTLLHKVLVGVYLVVVTKILLLQLIYFWPPSELAGKTPKEIPLLGVQLTWESQFLLIASVAGALGAMIHALRSYYRYLGDKKLVKSWIGFYLLRPLTGASLAVVFYLVIRAGFFTPSAGEGAMSAYGFAAVSALVGLFSEEALVKLREVAEVLLSKSEKGKDKIDD